MKKSLMGVKFHLVLIPLLFACHSAYCASPSPDSVSSIDDTLQRSGKSIVATILQNVARLTPLRKEQHRLHPGFKGRIDLKLGIAPSGAVVDDHIILSTTGSREFDIAVRDSVAKWRFKKVRKHDIVSVIIPFDFSKQDSVTDTSSEKSGTK